MGKNAYSMTVWTHTIFNYIVKRFGLYKDHEFKARGDTPEIIPFNIEKKDSIKGKLENVAKLFLNDLPNPVSGDYKITGYYRGVQNLKHESFSTDFNKMLAFAWQYYYTGNELWLNKFKIFLDAWKSSLGKPKHGGNSFYEWLIGREEGDTPIVTICQFPKLIFSMWLCGLNNDENKDWLKKYIDYANEYYPSQNNNHRTFKGLMLIIYGIVFNLPEYLNLGIRSYKSALDFVEKDGKMPLELYRDKKAVSYSLMNLEALTSCAYFLSKINIPKDKKLDNAALNLSKAFNENETWNELKISEQNMPERESDWGWIFKFYPNVTTVGMRGWYGIETPRAYFLLFPELF